MAILENRQIIKLPTNDSDGATRFSHIQSGNDFTGVNPFILVLDLRYYEGGFVYHVPKTFMVNNVHEIMLYSLFEVF